MRTRLKQLRKKLNLTQQDFGKSIKLSKSSISNIENGTINLTDRNIAQICEEHSVNEEWLRTGQGEMFIQMDKDAEFAYLVGALLAEDDPQKKEFIKAMLELDNKEDWDIIMRLAECLKEKNKKIRDLI